MKNLSIFIICTSLFYGCSLVPKIEKNKMVEITNLTKNTVPTLKFSSNNWWENYNDTNLTALINLTLSENPDLKIAQYNIQKSTEAITLAKSQGGTSIGLAGEVERGHLPNSISESFPSIKNYVPKLLNIGQLNLQASYDINLFNKIGALKKEAIFKSEATSLSKEFTKLNLSTQITKLYEYWIYLQIENQNLTNQFSIVKELFNIQYKNYNSGNGIKQQVLNSEIQVKNLENLIIQNELNQKITLNSLKELAGNKNSDKIVNILNNVNFNQDINIIVPKVVNSDIIINRPDIQYYLMLIKAQEQELKSAKAGFYPQFTITGNYGFSAIGLNNVFHRNTLSGLIGASVYLPIFHMGAIRSTYKIAGIDLNIVIEKYNQQVINAFTDINNELYKTNSLEETLKKQDEILKNQENSFKNIEINYNIGNISKYEYLQGKLQWLNNELQNKQQQFNLTSQKINFINSVGGIYIGGETNEKK